MEKTMTTPYRDSFVARFGEDDAARIEAAAEGHLTQGGLGAHADDDRSDDPFRYWFLAAISWECVTRYRDAHGIEATAEDMRDWALTEGDLGSFDGSPPDYLGLICGAYDGWFTEKKEQD